MTQWTSYVTYDPRHPARGPAILAIRPAMSGAVALPPPLEEHERAALVTLPYLPPTQEEHEAAIWTALQQAGLL